MANPVLFFSDLLSGPKSGWDGSATRGAAVSIWGLNLGSSQGTSTITCCGQVISAGTEVPEWGVTGTANGIARGLQRITFFLNSSMISAAGTIRVTVGGINSNTLPFTCRDTGVIYFISPTGNNAAAGNRTATPWRDASRISPSNNSALRPGDCIYFRNGTYTTLDDQGMFAHVRSSTYTIANAANPYAICAYPGEIPTFNGSSATRGFNYPEGTKTDYYTYSKLKFLNGWSSFVCSGQGTRCIGNWMQDLTQDLWSGVIWVSDAQNSHIYGNYWDNCGHDKYKHNIYAKTQPNGTGTIPVQYLYIGWNEFSRPLSSDGYGGTVFLSKSSDAGSIGDTLHIYIHDNYFHDGSCGDFIYTADNTSLISDVHIYNNLFVRGTNSGAGTIYWSAGSGSGFIYNNTFYLTSPNKPTIYYSGSGGGTVVCANNIYYNASGQAFFATEGGNTHVFQSNHDLFWQSGATTVPSGIANLTVSSAVAANPQLVTPGTDFHLQASSPAKDAGITNADAATDYEGITRGVFDIGAFEYVGGATDTTPPVISAVASSSITQSLATITWTTDESSNSQVEYGTTTAYGTFSGTNPSMVTAHSIPLSGLTANTLYHYRVRSTDASGNVGISGDFIFTTLGIPPAAPTGLQKIN